MPTIQNTMVNMIDIHINKLYIYYRIFHTQMVGTIVRHGRGCAHVALGPANTLEP